MRAMNLLSAAKVRTASSRGFLSDGGGLHLEITEGGHKRWVLRVTINGERVVRRLGSYPDVTLETAREKAHEIRRAAKEGRDLRGEQKRAAVGGTTFRQMFEISFEQRQKQLSNAKHLAQWPSTMEAYVFPRIGDKAVAEITTAQIIDVLTPQAGDRQAGTAADRHGLRGGDHPGRKG